jgi:hypothetical protein
MHPGENAVGDMARSSVVVPGTENTRRAYFGSAAEYGAGMVNIS